MDTLMDTLAQKLNAQEMIRANGEAEAQQMDMLKVQVGEYQGCLDRLQNVCGELGDLENRISSLSLPDKSAANEETINAIKERLEELSEKTGSQLEEFSQRTGSLIAELSRKTDSRLDEISEKTDSRIAELSQTTTSRLDEMTQTTTYRLDELSRTTSSRLDQMSQTTSSKLDAISDATSSNLKEFSDSTGKQLKDMQGEILGKVGMEDELHKEGVRIYKNLQAAIVNELEPVEETVIQTKKQILKEIGGLRLIAIVSLVMSTASLAVLILNILGII